MLIKDLVTKCIESIEFANKNKLTPTVTIVLKGRSKGDKRRMFGSNGGPVGTVVQHGIPDGHDTVMFDPREVLIWLDKHV